MDFIIGLFSLKNWYNIGRVERGINDISVSTLIRICEYFEIMPEDFFKRCR
jgi:transcriptional regulator with XRE-family HTH domain